MNRQVLVFLFTLLAVTFFCTPCSSAQEKLSHDQAVNVLAAWYMGVSAEETGRPLKHTSKPLVLELDARTRLDVPSHLAEQEVAEVQRLDLGPGLEDAVVVGIDARTGDGLHQGYVLVYARKEQQMVLQAELPLRERFERFEKAWVNRDEPVLVINGFSGNHFMDLWVYRFTGGQPELLFADGSAAGAEFRYDVTTPVPTIWIAAEDWTDPNWSFATGDRRWMVYTWNGREFVYNERVSSARETSVQERLALYTIRTLQRVDQLKVSKIGERVQKTLQAAEP